MNRWIYINIYIYTIAKTASNHLEIVFFPGFQILSGQWHFKLSVFYLTHAFTPSLNDCLYLFSTHIFEFIVFLFSFVKFSVVTAYIYILCIEYFFPFRLCWWIGNLDKFFILRYSFTSFIFCRIIYSVVYFTRFFFCNEPIKFFDKGKCL